MTLSLKALPLCTLLMASAVLLNAQSAPEGAASVPANDKSGNEAATAPQPSASAAQDQVIDKRIFGVLPNYRTASGSVPYESISARRKLWIASRDSFDKPVYVTAGAFAALYQIEDQNPSYGQGVEGYAKRYGSALADQAIGNMMTEGFVPALIHQDPRYFRIGSSSGATAFRRTLYALNAVNRAKNDNGKWAFNYSEWAGNAIATGISNAYYPGDTRNARDNARKLVVQVATDSFSNVLKEFWPDIKQKYFHKKKA